MNFSLVVKVWRIEYSPEKYYNNYTGVILSNKYEYAITGSDLSIVFRDTLNELDNANIISKK